MTQGVRGWGLEIWGGKMTKEVEGSWLWDTKETDEGSIPYSQTKRELELVYSMVWFLLGSEK